MLCKGQVCQILQVTLTHTNDMTVYMSVTDSMTMYVSGENTHVCHSC